MVDVSVSVCIVLAVYSPVDLLQLMPLYALPRCPNKYLQLNP